MRRVETVEAVSSVFFFQDQIFVVVRQNHLEAKHEPAERAYVHSVALQVVAAHAILHKRSKCFAHMRAQPFVLPGKSRLGGRGESAPVSRMAALSRVYAGARLLSHQ